MTNVIVSEFVSLDGVMEAPGGESGYAHTGWTMDFMSPGQMEYKLKETLDAEALLLGRKTYEGFAAAWPGRDDPQGFAAKMNRMPKHVATTTLSELEWENSSILQGDVPTAVRALKEQGAGDLLVAGSRTLVHTLLEHDLVDELRLMVFPIILGSGARVFPERPDTIVLRLAGTEAFDSGVVVQTYRRVV